MEQTVDKVQERYAGLNDPYLPLVCELYPLGFRTVIETNSTSVMELVKDMWQGFSHLFDADPIRVRIEVTESDRESILPEPQMRLRSGLMISIADDDNFGVSDLYSGISHIALSGATAKSKLWMRYYLLGPAPLLHISGQYALPVHAGCVAANGRGVLLCGESGDGKSTLSFACARDGWNYVTDDASYIIHGRSDRLAVGNYTQVRFRPTAADLFPEVQGREITPRAAGKPSIEIPTSTFPEINCSNSTQIDFIVFLNRRGSGSHDIRRVPKDRIRSFMRRSMFGTQHAMADHEETMERVVQDAEVVEMRYQDLRWAVDALGRMAGR